MPKTEQQELDQLARDHDWDVYTGPPRSYVVRRTGEYPGESLRHDGAPESSRYKNDYIEIHVRWHLDGTADEAVGPDGEIAPRFEGDTIAGALRVVIVERADR